MKCKLFTEGERIVGGEILELSSAEVMVLNKGIRAIIWGGEEIAPYERKAAIKMAKEFVNFECEERS